MKLSRIVEKILYREFCKGNKCKECKFDNNSLHCELEKIINKLKKHDKEYSCEENNKNK